MRRGIKASRWVLFLCLALGGAAFDLATKSVIFAEVGPPGSPPVAIVPEILELHTNYNPGALWGFGRSLPHSGLIFAGLSVLAISLMAVALARRVGKDLTEHESRFRAAFYQANVGMLKLDAEGKVIEANQAMADILDHRRDMLLQLSLGDLLMDGELVIDGVGRIDWDRQLRPSELRFRRRDGSLVWGRWSGTGVRSTGGGLSVFAIIEDVSQNHALAREIEHHASHDPLTGDRKSVV